MQSVPKTLLYLALLWTPTLAEDSPTSHFKTLDFRKNPNQLKWNNIVGPTPGLLGPSESPLDKAKEQKRVASKRYRTEAKLRTEYLESELQRTVFLNADLRAKLDFVIYDNCLNPFTLVFGEYKDIPDEMLIKYHAKCHDLWSAASFDPMTGAYLGSQ